jgi:hypothetical protein
MAQKVQVVLTCDLDEDEVPAVQTVSFGYDGYSYAFELCEQHLEEFNEAIQGYISAARLAEEAPGSRRRRSSNTAAAARPRRAVVSSPAEPSSSEVRSWARDNGFEISERGRIPSTVRAAFDEAHV